MFREEIIRKIETASATNICLTKVTTMTLLKKPLLFLLTSFSIAIFVFIKNAWVTEDAYILFRSLEQLFAGNGPIWNPHERVQVYTSPLWYAVLALTRILSSNLYLNVIALSFSFWLCIIFVLKNTFKDNNILLISILLLSASTGFFDYTSSGLENILAYLILTIYIYNYFELFSQEKHESSNSPAPRIKTAICLYGLIICVRHDLALLLFPATLYISLKHSDAFSTKQWSTLIIAALTPFVCFTIFSLIYYGFPFPNTAYAKLNTNINQLDLISQGINYYLSSIQYDSITLLIIIAALVTSLLKSTGKHTQCLAYGVILNLFYIAYVGGDFMQGRFFSYAYLVSVILVALQFKKIKFPHSELLSYSVIIGYLIFYPHTPFNSPFDYKQRQIKSGIADERGFYFDKLSLYSYVFPKKSATVFPDHQWAKSGLEFKNTHHKMTVDKYIGIFGYYAGTEKIIIDTLALSDPLLARIPALDKWRIGHFKRGIPDGYLASLAKNRELISDPKLNEFYKKLKIVTQSEKLFTTERLKTIFLFNIGAFDSQFSH